MSEKKDRFSVVAEGETLWPADYLSDSLHPNHCRDVLEGSYDIPWWPDKPPVIIDIGANVGAFVRWAVKRWPGCVIHAYEPEPNNFKLLRRTVKDLEDSAGVSVNELAVNDKAGRAKLKNWAFNCGEFSLYALQTDRKPHGEVEVEVKAAKDLPAADIIKIDAEGSETSIIPALFASGKINTVAAIMFEYHNEEDGANLKKGLEMNGFTLVGENVMAPHRGELQFMRTRLLDQLYPQ